MSNQEIQLLLGGKKEYSLLGTDGITHPNWGLGSLNELKIENNVTSDTLFRYIDLGIANGATWGNRYSFCISCTATTISEVYIVLSNVPAQANSAISLGSLLPSNNYYYSSTDNKYYTNFSNGTTPALYVYPNINTIGGQIYFRIEEDGKIYSGYGKNTSSLIATSVMTGTLYVGLVTKQTSGSGSGTFKMVSHTNNNPNPTPPPVTYTIPLTIKQTNPQSFNHTATLLNKYTSWNSHTVLNTYFFGEDIYYSLNINYNGNSGKFGFEVNSPTGQTPNVSGAEYNTVRYMSMYYDSLTGNCFVNNQNLLTITPNLTTLYLRLDSDTNFYVGSNSSNFQLVGNFKQTIIISNWGLSFTLASMFYHTSSLTGTTTLVSAGKNPSPFLSLPGGHTYPNFKTANGSGSYEFNNLTLNSSNATSPFYNANGLSFSSNSRGSITVTITNITGSLSIFAIGVSQNDGSYTGVIDTDYGTGGYYSGNTNFFHNKVNLLTSSAITPSPNMLAVGGQVYIEWREDKKVYIGRSKLTAVLVTTFPSFTTNHVFKVSYGGSGSFSFRIIEN